MKDLETIREEIARIDSEIVRLIDERLRLAEEVAEVKTKQGLPIVNPEVEKKVVDRYRSLAAERGIDEETAQKLARLLIDAAVARENEVIR